MTKTWKIIVYVDFSGNQFVKLVFAEIAVKAFVRGKMVKMAFGEDMKWI